ncbi:filamentous hemagglutinin N-terminal domain-containing protein [Aerosakkonema sp. BLCC-F183]|uniref:two-partner secretion domain-containing protein n=1 Tax=Aerosakkonema sp. BLCC-F183 TaxID=3342834 RepID=UPI0035B852BA
MRHLKFWFRVATSVFFLFSCKPTSAQIVPDTTIPNNSIVTPTGNTSLIEGGTQAGTNLFHSFQLFSVPNGGIAFFNNNLDIQNIISRVTGNSISNIDGLIQANGTANLFLLNPNGIIFGPNAKLNIGGSFFASTADALNFADGTQFSADNTQTPPLLTVSIPIGLQFGGNPGKITVQNAQIQVSPERTLALIGGDISLIGGNLIAQRGQIDLASLLTGNWSLIENQQTPTNNYGDIQLSQQSTVDASGSGGGNIQVRGRQIRLTDGSQIKANTQGGELGGSLTVNASESVEVIGRLADGTPSALQARVEADATGGGGNITITTGRLRVEGGARVAASSLTEKPANAGNITIRASDAVEVIGVGTVPQQEQTVIQPSAISTLTTGAGKAGNLEIVTGTLIAQQGGQISASTSGSGGGGTLKITADRIELSDRSPDGSLPSGLLARVESGGTGNAGELNIQTQSLRVTDGARVTAASQGWGNAGNLNIQSTDTVEVTGVGTNPDGTPNPAQISASTTANGKAGSLSIQTRRLIAQNGGQVAASTYAVGSGGSLNVTADEIELNDRSPDGSLPSGLLARVESQATGNAGELNIQTQSLRVTNGARVTAASQGLGNAGNLNIQSTDKIEITGVGRNPNGDANPAQISASTAGSGKAGSLTIQTARLIAENGGQVSASTFGTGDGGTLTVNAEEVDLSGRSPDGSFPSGLLARVENGATGNANNVNINTGRLRVRDGARVAAASLTQAPLNSATQGKAGNLNIRATDEVEITGVGRNPNGDPNPTQVSALSVGSGDAGTLNIQADRLRVGDGAEAIVSSTGSGNPGNLLVEAPSILINNRAALRAESATGKAGNIEMRSRDIQLRLQSRISAVSAARTAEGNIDINTETLVLLEGSEVRTDALNPEGGSNISIAPPPGLGLAVFQSTDSIIKPSGELRVEGEVQISPPDIPPVEFVDATGLIAQACPADDRGSSFFVTGRGGLPPSPDDPSNGDLFWEDLRIPGTGKPSNPSPIPNSQSSIPNKIIEAQGWIIGDKGEVILTAETPNFTPHQIALIPPECKQN